MIVLTSQDIKLAQENNQSASPTTTESFLSYQELSFLKVASFALNQFSEAVAKSREFLDLDTPVCAIVVTETDRITVWREFT